MVKHELSASLEDYLEAIYIIKKELNVVRTKELAKRLNVSLPSVTEAIKKLSENKFLKYKKYGHIVLTKKGGGKARGIYHKHRILLNFFTNVLNVDKGIAEIDACKTEHMLSQTTLNKLTKFLEKTG